MNEHQRRGPISDYWLSTGEEKCDSGDNSGDLFQRGSGNFPRAYSTPTLSLNRKSCNLPRGRACRAASGPADIYRGYRFGPRGGLYSPPPSPPHLLPVRFFPVSPGFFFFCFLFFGGRGGGRGSWMGKRRAIRKQRRPREWPLVRRAASSGNARRIYHADATTSGKRAASSKLAREQY